MSKHSIIATLSLTIIFLTAVADPLVYEGTSGPGKGKHIVFLAGDHEYRSEETMPALARIMAKVWMDAYLAAFAILHNLDFVTLDKDFKNFEKDGLRLKLLT